METKEFQRWTAKRKVELLLQLIRGERKLVDREPEAVPDCTDHCTDAPESLCRCGLPRTPLLIRQPFAQQRPRPAWFQEDLTCYVWTNGTASN